MGNVKVFGRTDGLTDRQTDGLTDSSTAIFHPTRGIKIEIILEVLSIRNDKTFVRMMQLFNESNSSINEILRYTVSSRLYNTPVNEMPVIASIDNPHNAGAP
ncbi:hypothetical protein DPMN_132349 [Dreissena polymorpha]|uniref:Uncharacterized protein n=1 Tax=Dreissena polymorpha TaxID=45954 RepID=A0A9D4FVY5_DREPO|nr:hypothetical protein DPMN_132349 [Dreissena polymorpha]